MFMRAMSPRVGATGDVTDDEGCSCRVAGATRGGGMGALAMLLGLAMLVRRLPHCHTLQ